MIQPIKKHGFVKNYIGQDWQPNIIRIKPPNNIPDQPIKNWVLRIWKKLLEKILNPNSASTLNLIAP